VKPEHVKSTITVNDVNLRLDKILETRSPLTDGTTPTQSKGTSTQASHSMAADCRKLPMRRADIGGVYVPVASAHLHREP
jgi:hypothetical protein